MYECRIIRRLLNGFLDRELNAKESLQVQNHLTACQPCRQEFLDEEQYRRLTEPAVPTIRAPEHTYAGVRRALDREAERANRQRTAQTPGGRPQPRAVIDDQNPLLPARRRRIPRPIAAAVAAHNTYRQAPERLPLHTSDGYAAKAWLENRLRYSVRVPLASADEFVLLGANTLTALRSAFLAFRVAGAPTSFLVFPTPYEPLPDAEPETLRDIPHYRTRVDDRDVLQWIDGGRTYVVVGDRETPLHSLPAALLPRPRSSDRPH